MIQGNLFALFRASGKTDTSLSILPFLDYSFSNYKNPALLIFIPECKVICNLYKDKIGKEWEDTSPFEEEESIIRY